MSTNNEDNEQTNNVETDLFQNIQDIIDRENQLQSHSQIFASISSGLEVFILDHQNIFRKQCMDTIMDDIPDIVYIDNQGIIHDSINTVENSTVDHQDKQDEDDAEDYSFCS